MGRRIKKAVFKFKPFSKKQLKVLTWWLPESPVHDKEGIIADGAIRSGKTLCMSLSFVIWAMSTFNSQNFGMCGKTIGSFRRNVLFWLKLMLKARGYRVADHRADNLLIVTKGDVENYFYIFGGKDERSQDLIQGITLAGCFFDEVALMPESFVNQATARCSVDGSKWWFNCNPDGPEHWFKKEWIDKLDEKKLVYLHFTMDDNLSLSEKIKERYRSQYSGVFYKRYIEGLWCIAEGIIYTMFDKKIHVVNERPDPRTIIDYTVSVDYGTRNPFSCGLWAFDGYKATRIDEVYYDSRKNEKRLDDEHLYELMDKMAAGYHVSQIIIDPSAASFIECIKTHGKYVCKAADNNVLDGIRIVTTFLNKGRLFIYKDCENCISEFAVYAWDDKGDKEQPVKESDHAMDDTRYYCKTYLQKRLRWKY